MAARIQELFSQHEFEHPLYLQPISGYSIDNILKIMGDTNTKMNSGKSSFWLSAGISRGLLWCICFLYKVLRFISAYSLRLINWMPFKFAPDQRVSSISLKNLSATGQQLSLRLQQIMDWQQQIENIRESRNYLEINPGDYIR